MNYGKTTNKEDYMLKALDFSLTYTDKVFDEEVKGLIKINLISRYIRILNSNSKRVNLNILDRYNYNLSASKEIFDYISSSDKTQSEPKMVEEFINYFSKINMEAFKEDAKVELKVEALICMYNDLNMDLSRDKLTSEELYKIYTNDIKEKYSSNVSVLKIG